MSTRNTGLEHLTDNELLKYKEIVSKLNSRSLSRIENNYDLKAAYHIVRLANECEQILIEGDLNLENSKDQLKAVRRGEMSLEELESWFKRKEEILDQLYVDSKLQYSPDYEKLKSVLFACLEEHYGSLNNVVGNTEVAKAISKLQQISKIVNS